MKRRCYQLFISLIAAFCLLFTVGCGEATAKATLAVSEETRIVVRLDEVGGEAVLTTALNTLQSEGKLDFTMAGGMNTEINGKANVTESTNSGYSWMIYTSNETLSYGDAYGTKTYGETVCYSANAGADTLKIAAGETIVLSYDRWSF